MKKIYSKIFWSIFFVLCIILFFKNYIKNSKLYSYYKYGINYNEVRLKKGIPLLPEYFEKIEDEYYDNLIIWGNTNPAYIDSSYTHVKKILTIRNSEILLEEDLFKKQDDNNTSEDYKELVSKYYYEEGDSRLIYIIKEYSNNSLKSIDTISVLEKIKSIDALNHHFIKK